MKKIYEKFLVTIRTYWQLIFIVLGSIAGFFLFRKQEVGFNDTVNKLLKNHSEEIDKINKIREEEKQQHLENEKKLKETLDVIQTQYDIAKKELDDKKKKQIEEIVKQYGNDPVKLAKQLSEATGFSIIMPS